jgi:hypothetical protein
MRSIKTTVTAAAVLTVGLVLTAPAAHAATAPQANSTCASAIHTAEMAKHDYTAAAADLKEQIAAGGHPGTAEEQNVADLMAKAKDAIWDAVEACKGMHNHHRHPHGAMHAGVGSTSQGVNGGELAGGVGMLGAAGAGALVLRRRRAGAGSES